MREARALHLKRRSGDPASLVASELATGDEPTLVLVTPTRRALVLGSAQRHLHVDEDALSATRCVLAHRRSGGGAVLVGPGEQVWADVFVPAGDERFVPDISKSAAFLAQWWIDALGQLGVGGLGIHEDAMRAGRFGRLVCFAGLGPGEVVDARGRKLVGISQRRDRSGAWLHSMVRLSDASEELAALLGDSEAIRAELRSALATTTTHLELPAGPIEAALVERARAAA